MFRFHDSVRANACDYGNQQPRKFEVLIEKKGGGGGLAKAKMRRPLTLYLTSNEKRAFATRTELSGLRTGEEVIITCRVSTSVPVVRYMHTSFMFGSRL